jgi:hypothetical protein
MHPGTITARLRAWADDRAAQQTQEITPCGLRVTEGWQHRRIHQILSRAAHDRRRGGFDPRALPPA